MMCGLDAKTVSGLLSYDPGLVVSIIKEEPNFATTPVGKLGTFLAKASHTLKDNAEPSTVLRGHFAGVDQRYLSHVISSARWRADLIEDPEAVNRLYEANTSGTPLEQPISIGRLSDKCPCCAKKLQLVTDGVQLMVAEPCAYPNGIYPITASLNLPSGKLVLANDLREWFPIWGDYDVNTSFGVAQTTKRYAELGMLHCSVGNSCPGVYQFGDNEVAIASVDHDGDEIEDDDELDDDDEIHDGDELDKDKEIEDTEELDEDEEINDTDEPDEGVELEEKVDYVVIYEAGISLVGEPSQEDSESDQADESATNPQRSVSDAPQGMPTNSDLVLDRKESVDGQDRGWLPSMSDALKGIPTNPDSVSDKKESLDGQDKGWLPSMRRALGLPTKSEVTQERTAADYAAAEKGSICTDLWWWSGVDYDEFKRRVEKTGGNFEEVLKRVDAIVLDLTPGLYQVSHRRGKGGEEDRGSFEFSTIKRLGDPEPVEDFERKMDIHLSASQLVMQSIHMYAYSYLGRDYEWVESLSVSDFALLWRDLPLDTKLSSILGAATHTLFCNGNGVDWHPNGWGSGCPDMPFFYPTFDIPQLPPKVCLNHISPGYFAVADATGVESAFGAKPEKIVTEFGVDYLLVEPSIKFNPSYAKLVFNILQANIRGVEAEIASGKLNSYSGQGFSLRNLLVDYLGASDRGKKNWFKSLLRKIVPDKFAEAIFEEHKERWDSISKRRAYDLSRVVFKRMCELYPEHIPEYCIDLAPEPNNVLEAHRRSVRSREFATGDNFFFNDGPGVAREG